jgi:hypothetical protein
MTFPESKVVCQRTIVRPSSLFMMYDASCAPTRAVREMSARERNFMVDSEEKCEDANTWADGEARKQGEDYVALIDAREKPPYCAIWRVFGCEEVDRESGVLAQRRMTRR